MVNPFVNEPLTDFSNPDNFACQKKAIEEIETGVGRHYPVMIGGEVVETEGVIKSINPSKPSQVIGTAGSATPEMAQLAVSKAHSAFASWSRVSAQGRAAILFRAASIMRRRRFELNAVEILEAGKPWVEADADVAEAIDFCEFYAREMIRLSGAQPTDPLPGEDDNIYYIPVGVVAVIPPWNFPLAITAGMTVGALVAGNTVVLKPASATPIIAWYLYDILESAGLPAGVLNFLPGPGGSMGDALVGHPLTRMIAFTGSMDVGIHINEMAAKVAPGQIWLKRVVAEMGGKDFILVTEEADLDAASTAIVSSAFGFQGQKCSACSRAIIEAKVYDKVCEMVVEKARQLTIGPAKDPANKIGPVISESAMKSIMRYIEIGKGDGECVLGGARASYDGYFIEPTVIKDIKPGAVIEQEEIFGPVVAMIKAVDFDDALKIANDTMYGLTGSVFSRSREKLERARVEAHVGNLYLNRKCTGAMVSAHPFGGFNMSGTDSKAGGHDYLLLFMQAKSVAEAL